MWSIPSLRRCDSGSSGYNKSVLLWNFLLGRLRRVFRRRRPKSEPSVSGSDLERRRSEVNELLRLRESERYEACVDDEGAYRFRRGR